MPHDVIIPALGVAMEEGLLVKWLKQPGEPVGAGEPLCEIETDKATMEIESPVSGIVGEHLHGEDTLLPVGTVITRILEGAASVAIEDVAPVVERAPVERSKGGYVALTTSVGEGLMPIDTSGIAADRLLAWLELMVFIREFETQADQLSLAGKIPGGVHCSVGQEAVAVGAMHALADGDIVASAHRSHHHALARGLDPNAVMAELYGKATGVRGGRGGTMHLADFEIGYYGGNGIVGAAVGIACGAALAAKMRGLDQFALGFVGDAGANTGRTWEAVNLAVAWNLPVIVVCENNQYGVQTPIGRVTGGESIAKRASGFGIYAQQVDGQDVVSVHRAVRQARERGGPSFIEALTYRYHGHNTGEIVGYRTDDEVEVWRTTKDPIARLCAAVDADLAPLETRARERVAEAVAFADASPYPPPGAAMEGVLGLDAPVKENPWRS